MAVTTRAASVATSRAPLDDVGQLRLAARRQGDRCDQGVERGQEMERRGLGPGAIPGAGVHDPDEGPGQGEAERDRDGRRDPTRYGDPPTDDDARHGQAEEERPGAARNDPMCAESDAGAATTGSFPAVSCTSSCTVIDRLPRTARPQGSPTPRPPRSFHRACARCGRRPRPRWRRGSPARSSAPRCAGGSGVR